MKLKLLLFVSTLLALISGFLYLQQSNPEIKEYSQNGYILKESTAQILVAYFSLQQHNSKIENVSSQDIILCTNFVRKETKAKQRSESYPCIQAHNGAFTACDRKATFASSGNKLIFLIDPDANGPTEGIPIVLDIAGKINPLKEKQVWDSIKLNPTPVSLDWLYGERFQNEIKSNFAQRKYQK